jgi:hypothetical protein
MPIFPNLGDEDVTFAGGGGLQFGEIYVKDNAVTTTLNSAAKVQVTVFASNGESNGSITPDHTNDHITVGVDGKFLVMVSLSFKNNAAQSHLVSIGVFSNNGVTEFPNIHSDRSLTGGSGDVGSVSLSGIISVSLGDTIELWANTDVAADRSVTFEDISLSIIQVGS